MRRLRSLRTKPKLHFQVLVLLLPWRLRGLLCFAVLLLLLLLLLVIPHGLWPKCLVVLLILLLFGVVRCGRSHAVLIMLKCLLPVKIL
jgi:hypothetical protein